MIPSFERINYAVRPNKNVERKLIVEILAALQSLFDIRKYNYIGLGSMWFVDFILMHKTLLIDKMYSIEKPEYSKRAEFNKPYNCISVIPGETTDILPDLRLEEHRSIIWLDYDSGIEGPALQDIEIVCNSAKSGSVMIVTADADKDHLPTKDEHDQALLPEHALRKYASILVPPTLPKGIFENRKKFARLIGEILLNCTRNAIRSSGRKASFSPMFNFYYRDTASMVTTGGMIANDDDQKLLHKCALSNKFEWFSDQQLEINVPPLTPKEKFELDRLLPSPNPPDREEIEKKGFPLDQGQIDSYHKFYRHYPLFTEFQF